MSAEPRPMFGSPQSQLSLMSDYRADNSSTA